MDGVPGAIRPWPRRLNGSPSPRRGGFWGVPPVPGRCLLGVWGRTGGRTVGRAIGRAVQGSGVRRLAVEEPGEGWGEVGELVPFGSVVGEADVARPDSEGAEGE
jgi:hypothetical protein